MVRKSWFKSGLYGSIAVSVASLAMIIPGIIVMANNEFINTEPLFNSFNVGLTLFVLGMSLLLGLVISIPQLIEGMKNKHAQ